MRHFLVLLAAFALLAAVPVGAAARPGPAGARSVDPAIAYWTEARIAHAIPRDFVRLANGKFVPAAKGGPGGGGGGGGAKPVTGASWTGGSTIVKQSGRVLFHLRSGDYICSASVVDDADDPTYSVIVTAGHCVYDEENHEFATMWVYYPSFDTSPTYTCAQATYGCWAARALFAHSGFTSQSGFTATATLYDFGFAVVRAGGNGGSVSPQLDALGSYSVNPTLTSSPGIGYAFGYPAGGQYAPGIDLTYCKGSIGTDPYNANRTWKIGCDMTGGSSGGPWLYGTSDPGSAGRSEGTVFSVNSYTYSGVKAMHGPKFNANTQAVLDAALAAAPDDNGLDTHIVGP